MTLGRGWCVAIACVLCEAAVSLRPVQAQDHFRPYSTPATASRPVSAEGQQTKELPPAERIPIPPMPADQPTRSLDPWGSGPWGRNTATSFDGPAVEAVGIEARGPITFVEVEHPRNGISPRIDYLLWRARRRGLDFAMVDPNDNGLPEGPVLSTFYDTDSGVRFGFAFALPGPEWELAAYYTYFHAHGNQTFLAPPEGVIHATLLAPVGPRQVSGAFAQANVDLDLVDLQFGPRLAVGETVLIHFFGGLRAGQVKMRHNAFYTGGDTGGFDELLSFSGARSFNEVRFRGLGLRVGSEGAWKFAEYTSVFARGGVSLLSGRFSEELLQDDAGQPLVQLAEKWEQVVPILELAVGMSYEFREDMRLTLGYEFSHWFGLADSVDLSDDVAVGKTTRRQSDLTFEGLFVQLAIAF